MIFPISEKGKSSLKFGVAAIFILVSGQALATAPAAAKDCAGCHTASGVSENPDTPTIAGASEFFLENQFILFKEKSRPCVADLFSQAKEKPAAKDHCAVMEKLSDDDVKKLTKHYSKLPFKSVKQEVDDKLVQAGKKLHDQRCSKCHSGGGSEPADDAGLLAGQPKPYLIRTMHDYKKQERWQDDKMKKEMVKLSDDQIKALAEYYASQGK